jgi:NADPH-dependent 2,4-dienoyl-CoA reductase/sulfur reductase-like enzyme/nitrite reductase/ring-hydroxylating ferredoxin subunit
MGAGETKLIGPDFQAGIAPDALPDGGLLLGHAQGEAVLLARRGRELFAVGATCTHYGGPLAEGLFTGDEIRCPWHHACFSLHSGEPLRAPALNPIACFDVEERGGKLLVLRKRPTPASTRLKTNLSSVVIAGAGAAGNACAERLRRDGYEGRLVMVGSEASVPVDRPNLSKDYLAGNAPEEWIPLRGEDFYRDQNIDLYLDTRVARVDAANKSVTFSDGRTLSYGALVLATGAAPVRLPLPGADAGHVLTLRTLSDSRAIIAKAATAKRAVLVGAGFIGLEVAASLRTRGVEVHVVAPEALPLARILGNALGAFVKAVHEEHGVVFHLGTTAKAIAPNSVTLASGEEIPADLVVIGVGVSPEVGLAQAAGITINRGIVVDEYLRTSAPDVWAAGDVARWPDARSGENIRVEHWVVAERMGQIAARNVLGQRQRCDIVPFFWSAHYDVTINYVGHAQTWDGIDVAGNVDARDAAVAFRRAGRTLAMATLGRDGACLEAEAAMERGDEAALGRIVPPRSSAS